MEDLFSATRREDATLFVRNSRSVSNVASENSFLPSFRDDSESSRSHCFLISITSPARMRWDILIMLLAIWNCFYVPFVSAFATFDKDITLRTVDLTIDCLYVLDIVVNLRTTFLDESSGYEVHNVQRITWRYVCSMRFYCDVLASLPVELVNWAASDSSNRLQMLTLLKMIRLLRLSKIIMFMRTRNHIKLRMKLLHLLLVLLIFLHTQACLWFMLNSMEEQYIPPTDYVHRHTLLYHDSVLRSYSLSLYMSVYMLTAAEIGPRTGWERIYAGCCILIGQLFQAYMFGEISVVLFNLNLKAARITEIQDAAVTSMTNMQLTPQLQTRVADFLVASQGWVTKQTEFEEFFKILPPSLKQDVRAFLFNKAISGRSLISQHSELSISILHRLSNLYCQPEFNVVTQGEVPTALYFLVAGRCEVEVLDEHKNPHRVKKLKEGAHFGEVALVYNTNRTATVRTIDYANVAVLSKEDFIAVYHKFPKALDIFRNAASKYHDSWKHFLKSTLRRCPYFKRVSGSTLSQVIYMLPTERVATNTYIYKEGDQATKVVFILDGKVEVYMPVNDSRLSMFPSADMFLRENPMLANRIQFRRGSLLALNRKENMRFLLKMAMEDLGMGSVLCPNLLLVQDKVSVYYKATETTTFLTMDLPLLKKLCLRFSDIKDAVERYRNELFVYDPYAKLRRPKINPLDYVKCFEYEGLQAKMNIWRARFKVKRAVIQKLFTRRAIRSRGVLDLLVMSRRLRALMQADATGDHALAEKIRRGIIPSGSEDLIAAMQLLRTDEVERPLMTQFALAATQLGKTLQDVHDHNFLLEQSSDSVARQRLGLRKLLADTQHIAALLHRLDEAKRLQHL